MFFLGIDIAKRTMAVALLRPDGTWRSKSVANTADGHRDLLAWVGRHAPAGSLHVCLEATGTYGTAVAETLHDAGHRVSIVNPAAIEAFGRSRLSRTKTDPTDARLIAQFCRAQEPPPWTPLPRELRELQALVRRLDALEGMRQQERNRLAADPGSAVVCASIQHLIDTLDDEMVALQGQIHDHFDRHPPLRQQRDLLTSIPGIGAATAAILIAEFGPMRRFAQARQCAAFVGVVGGIHPVVPARQARAVQAWLRRRAQSLVLSGPHGVALQSRRHRVAQPPTTQRQAPHGDRRRGDA